MLIRFVFRNLRKRPLLNLIKVIGLALALSGILFITAFLKNELSYDAYHQQANRIYRFTTTNPGFISNKHFARFYQSEIIPELKNYFPEIENYARMAPVRGGVLMHNERYFNIDQGFICDSTFLNLFDVEMVNGNGAEILNAPASMIVTQCFANKIFGNKNPIGETLTIPTGQFYGQAMSFTVKGVMKAFPQNSHFHPDFISSSSDGQIQGWAWSYLLLNANANANEITAAYPKFLADRFNQNIDEVKTEAHLQKLCDIHLYSTKLREIEDNGNLNYLYVFIIAVLILLFIALSNYASLNMGMSGFSNRFININRVLGSSKNLNLKHFLFESLIIVITSCIVAAIITIPANAIIQNQTGINLLNNNELLILLVVVTFTILGIAAGILPLIQLKFKSSNNTKAILPNKTKLVVSKNIIVFQYALAIVLIAVVLLIGKQTKFALNTALSSQNENVICMESVHGSIQQKFDVFKSELLKYNTIESVSAMMEPPGGEANDMFRFEMEGLEVEDAEHKNWIGVFPCDYSFAALFQLNFLGGNNFSTSHADVEGSGEYIINKAALAQLNHTNASTAIGKNFRLIWNVKGIEIPSGKIIGVVDDFHLSSIRKAVVPLVLFKRKNLWLINFVIAYKPEMKAAALADINKVWTQLFPAYPISYQHVGSMYRKVYKTELLQARLLSIFTLMALFICSMGLLGISLLITQQRVKEIGVRKVNGASIGEILSLLNKSYVLWLGIAFVIATPIAYIAMKKWLENFACKTELSWWIFALAGIVTLGIALLTVSWQSWKAATRNPVEALRYE